MTGVQSVNNVFADGYGIKVYELCNHDRKWPGNVHAHAYVQLWYVYQGKCTHEIGGVAYEVNEGELFIVPPYVEHKVSAVKDSCVIYGCDFILEIVSEDRLLVSMAGREKEAGSSKDFMASILRVQGKYVLPEVLQARTESTLRKMLMVYLKKQPYGIIELKGYLLRLLANIFQSVEGSSSAVSDQDVHASNINDAIAYINEHLADRIYLEEIARHVSMSVRSFNNYFKLHTGRTYVDYLNTVRLDVAKTLLIETGMGIAAIGQRVGFVDAAYFSRQFKKYVGCTPGEYRTIHTDG